MADEHGRLRNISAGDSQADLRQLPVPIASDEAVLRPSKIGRSRRTKQEAHGICWSEPRASLAVLVGGTVDQ